MIPELGHLALWLALGVTVGQALLPTLGIRRRDTVLLESGGFLAAGQFVFVLIAYLCLTWVFVHNDFSVSYVVANSNTALPVHYRISAVWGAHEGSFLLWILIMSCWNLAVAWQGWRLPADMRARILAVMAFLAAGFMLFLLLTSNPFARILPLAPDNGGDLNPQLQDIGLIIHPPLLYLGYTGFVVAFAFAVAVLWKGRMDNAWIRWVRPWATAAWAFLAIGIVLGSWWAYYELGWGGWWFWDAVENVSLIPWLAGTALIHSLAVSSKRGGFANWSLLLAILTFSLVLLGAFVVRSGVLTSVHAFAVNPERGLFLMVFLCLVVGGALALYAVRATTIVSRLRYDLLSRESFLLINNLLLVVSLATILFGTLFPLAYEALSGGERISVGAPWFNKVMVPLLALLAVFMAVGPLAGWRRTSGKTLLRQLATIFSGSLVLGVGLPLAVTGAFAWQVFLAVTLAAWIVLSLCLDLWCRWWQRADRGALSRGYFGMWTAHLGFAVCLLGVSMSSSYEVEKSLRMAPGELFSLYGHTFEFNGTTAVPGPNYIADMGDFRVVDADGDVWHMHPEKRHYPVRGLVMTEAAIDPGVFRDLYIVLGESLDDTGAWSVRIQIKPFVRWIWAGGLLMAFGGLLTVWSRRRQGRRVLQRRPVPGGLVVRA